MLILIHMLIPQKDDLA